jgi:hypothetical protein
MAITMIDAYHVKNTPFEESYLLSKLKRAIICARLFESQNASWSAVSSILPV